MSKSSLKIAVPPCTAIVPRASPESHVDPQSPLSPPYTPTENSWWALLDDISPRNKSSQSCTGLFRLLNDVDDLEGDDDSADVDQLKGSFSSADGNKETKLGLFRDMFRCGGNLNSIDNDNAFSESPCALLSDVRDFTFAHEDPEFDEIYEISSSEDDSILAKGVWAGGGNVFEELEEEISFLRDRTAAVKTSSTKYKSMVSRKELARLATLKAKEEAQIPSSDKPPSARRVAFMDENVNKNAPKKQPAIRPSTPFEPLIYNAKKVSAKLAFQQSKPKSTPKPNEHEQETEGLIEVNSTAPTEDVQVYSATSADLEEDKELPPPVKLIDPCANDSAHDHEDDLLRGMSTLTQDLSLAWEGSSPRRSSMLSMSPNLLKKLQGLKNLKMTKKPNASSNASIVSGPSLAHSCINTVVPGDKQGRFVYERDPKINSYVAYFRRGGKASDTVRVYEHITPAVFPTADNEMVVKIEASTVSSTDCQVRSSLFWEEGSANSLNLPIVPGVAFVGTIMQLSKGGFRSGTGLHVGDRVISLVPSGSNARHLCISADRLVKVPDSIKNHVAAACLPEVYLAAFQALHLGKRNGARYRRSSLSGKCVLVLGGATALGRAIIELSVAAGCDTIYATGKEKQYDAITSVGGAPLGRDPKQWGSVLGGRVDIILGIDDSVGQSELCQDHMLLLRPLEGRVVLFCAPGQDESSVINLDDQTFATASTTGRKVFHHNVFEAWNENQKQGKRDLAHLLKLLGEDHVAPKILERIPLNRVAKAQDLMEGKKLNGFILCEPWIKGRSKEQDKRDEASSVPVRGSDTRETIENIPQTPVKSPLSAVVGQMSPLALFGEKGFWKTVAVSRWTGGSAADPNQTPTAANLKKTRSPMNGKWHLQDMIQN